MIVEKPVRAIERLYKRFGRKLTAPSKRALGTLPKATIEAVYRDVKAKVEAFEKTLKEMA